jgi:chemotaxis protein CheC
MKIEDLRTVQLDAIKEVASIGACHAATALSEMIQKRVMVQVPQLRLCLLEEISVLLGPPELPITGVLISFSGSLEGRSVMALPFEYSRLLVDRLLQRERGTTQEFGELESSALKEAGNILVSSYMNALADFLGVTVMPSPPDLAIDMAGAVLLATLLDYGKSQEPVIVIENELRFIEDDDVILGYLILSPEPKSLQAILQAVHMT